MINCRELFPFREIAPNSKIVIYGLGYYGKSYISQVQATCYCNIVAISDKQMKPMQEIPFIELDDINTIDFDYIIIAILDENITNDVEKELIKRGIASSKIIKNLTYNCNKKLKKPVIGKRECVKPKIALRVYGGFGDHIVSEAFFEKMKSLIPDAEYTIFGKRDFLDICYYGKDIGDLCNSDCLLMEEYDLVLSIRLSIGVIYQNEEYIANHTVLNKIVNSFISGNGEYELETIGSTKDAVLLKRAQLAKKNRFSFLCGDAFELSSADVKLVLNPDYCEEFLKINLENYITINYGADKFSNDYDQTKVWPYDYYVKLVAMIKKIYPDIKIIQIGDNNSTEIEGVDGKLFGKSLFFIEYVLKNSKLHIDCEGGLTHLAVAMKTKCVVIFGPTPVFFYGYKQNINIVSSVCNNCMGTDDNWMFKCPRGMEEPECMRSITPEEVIENIDKYFRIQKDD